MLTSANPTAIDVNNIVRNLVAGREAACGIAFNMDLAQTSPKVSGNPHQIEHVLWTLLVHAEHCVSNAFGKSGIVHVQTAVHAEHASITVTNYGRGIDSSEMDNLFDPSTNPEMSACAAIVKAHGGHVYVWSGYRRGSVFTVEFPVCAPRVAPALPVQQPAPAPLFKGKRILVIDDEIHVTALIAEVLRRQGASIDLANVGEDGIEFIKRSDYDAVICDHHMPGMTGERLYRFAEWLKPGIRTRFLFVSGGNVGEESAQFYAQNGVQHVMKPFRAVELLEAIQCVLSRNRPLDS